MKRFTKLERARGEEPDSEPAPASTKRFEAIEKARAEAPAAGAFGPPVDTSPPVQLELHDRYTESVEDARRTRQKRATQDLTDLEVRREEQKRPHRAPDVLDVIAHGLAIGPLAKITPEQRLWVLGALLLAVWIGVGVAVSGAAAIVASAVLVGALVVIGWVRTRAT